MNPLSTSDREPSRIAAAYERRKRPDFPVQYSGFDPANLFRIQELERKIFSALKKFGIAPLQDKRILEIGCGSGFWLRQFIQWGALPENLAGIDLLPERIASAREVCAAGVSLQCGDASQLPYPDQSFDLVFQATVFTSILDRAMKERIAAEMLRVSRPGGLILWYDFFLNNPSNPDVRGIGKREITELFPRCPTTFDRLTLAPPLARHIGGSSSVFYSLLSAMKLFNTHYLASIAKLPCLSVPPRSKLLLNSRHD